MKNIIEEMYDGDLFPIGTYNHSSKEYKKAMDELVAAESKLLASYPQIRELFNRYQSAQIEIISINNRQEFVNGFRIGAKIALEIIDTIE
ncbi:MAG: myb domain-containing protein [Ruminococcus sp.]|nr:myb domain-containing protein [Ruminococcus sp.]